MWKILCSITKIPLNACITLYIKKPEGMSVGPRQDFEKTYIVSTGGEPSEDTMSLTCSYFEYWAL